MNYPYIPPSTADKKAITPTGMLTAKSTKPGSVLLLETIESFYWKTKTILFPRPVPVRVSLREELHVEGGVPSLTADQADH